MSSRKYVFEPLKSIFVIVALYIFYRFHKVIFTGVLHGSHDILI